jgi:hypothetical protein
MAAAWRTEVISSCRFTRRTLAGPHRSPRRSSFRAQIHPRSALQRAIVHRFTFMTGDHDQQSGGHQLITGMGGRPAPHKPGSVRGRRAAKRLTAESHLRPPAILVISVDRHQYRHRGAHLHHRLDIFHNHGLSRRRSSSADRRIVSSRPLTSANPTERRRDQVLADLLPNPSGLPFQVRPTLRLDRNPRGKRPNPSRCRLPLCLTLKPGAGLPDSARSPILARPPDRTPAAALLAKPRWS